jgi:hypothetical protein
MATANGTVTGGASGNSSKLSPPRPNTAYSGSQGGSSQQAQAQPGPAPARASGGPGSGPLPPQQRSHHKSHSAGNLLAASMQGLSLATPAEDMLGPHPGPSVVPDLGLPMRGAHPHHPADLEGHLAAARQQQGPPGSAQQRLMYQVPHPLLFGHCRTWQKGACHP